MSISPGTKLGQYEVQDFIGQGAMGLVYRAYHAQLERTGAVKVLQGIAPDADTTTRFRHEAQAIAQLRHPNILNVYDFGELNGTPYMIVEYVPGGSLAGRMSQGRLDQASAVRYLRGIAAGLDYAHAHGIVHRDVKPANVLLEQDDTPVLADFGLAKLLQGSSLKSMTGVTTGTPAYMAPEQVIGNKIGPAADRYSLATIAYEMLTGVIPFDGQALLELLYAQVHRDPPVPSSRDGSLAPRVDAVIMRGLAKDPEARWPTCTAFVNALEAALADAPAPVLAVGRTLVVAPADTATAPTSRLAPVATVPLSTAALPTRRILRPDATAAIAYEPAATPKPKRQSRKLAYTIGSIALVAILLLSLGICAAANQPSLSLSRSTVLAGESVVVDAKHLPANQVGEIHLQSQLYVFPFRADKDGVVSREISVPVDIELGDHLVSICWNGACHAHATLTVVSGVAQTTPSASPSPSTSPRPSASPSPHPSASPSPSLQPTPRATSTPGVQPPKISISNYYITLTARTETVYGFHFTVGYVPVYFVQGGTPSTNVQVGTGYVSGGRFTVYFSIPVGVHTGSAAVKACISPGNCLFATVDVVA